MTAASRRPAAVGRTIDDFVPLSAAEAALRDACRRGQPLDLGARPDAAEPTRVVRAGFVRFLALGGDEATPVHEDGVQLAGGWIEGRLDFSSAEAARPLVLERCTFPEPVFANDASFVGVNLSGSRFASGLQADRARIDGGLFLRDAAVEGRLLLLGVRVQGDLDFSDARLTAPEAAARPAAEDPFAGLALGFDLGRIEGSVFLRRTIVTGGIQLFGASMANLLCEGATFGLFGEDVPAPGRRDGPAALNADGARITGVLRFTPAAVRGPVDLTNVSTGVLEDALERWPRGQLALDGFTYGRLSSRTSCAAAARIDWLGRQSKDDLGDAFKPQPWEQLAATLRAMGHPEDAKCVAVAQRDRLRAGKWAKSGPVRKLGWVFHWLHGFFFRYGYWPWRPIAAILVVWLGCAVIYDRAADRSASGVERVIDLARPPAATPGRPPPQTDYAAFEPLVYSADVLLPIVNFGQEAEWAPVASTPGGRALRWWVWGEIAFGWIAGLVLGAAAGGLVRKD